MEKTDTDSDCVLIYSDVFTSDKSFFNTFLVKCSNNFDSSLYIKLRLISDFGLYNYMNSIGLHQEPSKDIENSREFLNGMTRNGGIWGI